MTRFIVILLIFLLAACDGDESPQVIQATVPPAELTAPVYTETASNTPTLTPTLTRTPTPSVTPTPSNTPTLTPTLTLTPSPTLTTTPTQSLLTLTPPDSDDAPQVPSLPTADFTTPAGWSCGDFPCEDDIDGFLSRIRVPAGFVVAHVGQFPGQPMQIAYGPDGRLYATVLEGGTRAGAVYVMDDDGEAELYSEALISPIGLAFQPGTDTLYVSARETLESGGGVWRVLPDGTTEQVIDELPCCFAVIDNQPNGMIFGPDGFLYLGVGALTDHAEPPNPERQRVAQLHPYEAAVLRIQPHTGAVAVYAQGIRNPYDLTFDSNGQFYATDNGVLQGPGDRLLEIDPGGHYGWPYWRGRGCEECPLTDPRVEVQPDLLRFPDYTLPRGLTAYTGEQFPANLFDSVFVALWHNTPNAQRVVRIDPETVPPIPEPGVQDDEAVEAYEAYQPEPFITGLIRPVDVVVAPDGALVVADFIYGHIWKVSYTGEIPARAFVTATPIPPTDAATQEQEQEPSIFVTATPRD